MAKATILGSAAVAGLMSVSVANAAPIGKINLNSDVKKVGWMSEYGNLHAPPAGPGWLGKGYVAPEGYGGRRRHR